MAACSQLRSPSPTGPPCSVAREQKFACKWAGTLSQQASNRKIHAAMMSPARTSQSTAAIPSSPADIVAILSQRKICDACAGNALPRKMSACIFGPTRSFCNVLLDRVSEIKFQGVIIWEIRKPPYPLSAIERNFCNAAFAIHRSPISFSNFPAAMQYIHSASMLKWHWLHRSRTSLHLGSKTAALQMPQLFRVHTRDRKATPLCQAADFRDNFPCRLWRLIKYH